MAIDIKVPQLPESVADATVATWHKKSGDAVKRGENLVDLETDKVMLEVPAPQDGVLGSILKTEGTHVKAGELLSELQEGAAKAAEAEPAPAPKKTETVSAETIQEPEKEEVVTEQGLSPSVRRLMVEHEVDIDQVKGTGKGGRVTKEDILRVVEGGRKEARAEKPQVEEKAEVSEAPAPAGGAREEKRVPMSRLRARVAERLLQAQQSTAMLTTFNEVNMKPVMDLRAKYKQQFEQAHGTRLGFMSFFVKASIEALKRFPMVNASIDGNDIVYHGYFDIGIAVSTPRGLVVPILRNADHYSMAEIEKKIVDFANRARDAKLTMEEMTGGTFTITNGGVFGSLLSTPILNPPQSAILGMHKIEDRPVVENGEIVIRPIMYLAMTYDHRIIDGRESVTFLRTIKELLEDPARLLLEI